MSDIYIIYMMIDLNAINSPGYLSKVSPWVDWTEFDDFDNNGLSYSRNLIQNIETMF